MINFNTRFESTMQELETAIGNMNSRSTACSSPLRAVCSAVTGSMNGSNVSMGVAAVAQLPAHRRVLSIRIACSSFPPPFQGASDTENTQQQRAKDAHAAPEGGAPSRLSSSFPSFTPSHGKSSPTNTK